MNRDPVETFLSLIYPSDSCWIALCLIPPDAQRPQHRFTTVDNLSRFFPYARYRNAAGWGVYITPSVLEPNARNRRKESFLKQQTVIYLDCDQAQCLERIKQRYPYPTLVVRTSKGRYQVYWRLDQPVDVTRQEQLMSAMAIDSDADRAATDVSRVLRVPSFWNRKPGRNNSVNIVFTRDHAVSYQSLLEPTHPSCSRTAPPQTLPSTRDGKGIVLADLRKQKRSSRQRLTESERDWYEVNRLLALNHAPCDVVNWLEARRPDKADPAYYAKLTVRKAVDQCRRQDP